MGTQVTTSAAPDDGDEEKKKAIVSPERLKKMAEWETRSKLPQGWGKRSKSAYYKETFGQEMKELFDYIRTEGKPKCYYFADARRVGLSPTSLYMRINHSIRFLIEQMDFDCSYKKQYDTDIDVKKELGVGWWITPRKTAQSFGVVPRSIDEKPSGEVVEAVVHDKMTIKSTIPAWRDKLNLFLKMSQAGDEFSKSNMSLTRVEIDQLESEFLMLDTEYIWSFTSAKVFIVRTAERIVNAD